MNAGVSTRPCGVVERTEARAAVGRAQTESEAGHRYYSYFT